MNTEDNDCAATHKHEKERGAIISKPNEAAPENPYITTGIRKSPEAGIQTRAVAAWRQDGSGMLPRKSGRPSPMEVRRRVSDLEFRTSQWSWQLQP
jgi:hypothetical protein